MMFGGLAKKPNQVTGRDEKTVEVEESLGALERGRQLGHSRLSLQRLVFVNELVDCAHEIGYEPTVAHLLPLVRSLASDPEVLVRQQLVGTFGDLAGFLIQSDPERGYQKVVDDLLPIVSLLLVEKAAEARLGAAEALTTLASHLRPGERGDQVLMTVIELSHSNNDEDARSTAVQLLNGLAETLGRDLCRSFVGVELVALCEDPADRVRKSTASNFAEVSRVVGDDYVLKRLLPAFSGLVRDPHWGVRKAAAENLVGVVMALKPEMREDPLVPLMNALLKDPQKWVKMSALEQLGYCIAALEMPERVPSALLLQYVDIIEQAKAEPGAADICFHCGYTFAAVTKTMGKAGWTTFALEAPFVSLCKASQPKTRKAMAASIHIVAQTVGPQITEQEVLPQFEALLQDTGAEVRLAALKNVAPILRACYKPASHQRLLKALQGAMVKAETWRLRHLVASQVGPICEALVGAPIPGATEERSIDGSNGTPRTQTVVSDPGSTPGDGDGAGTGASAPTSAVVGEGGSASGAASAASDSGGAAVAADGGSEGIEAVGEGSDPSVMATPEEQSASTTAKELARYVIIPLFLQLCLDGVAEVRDEAARATARALRSAAPELLSEVPPSEGSSGCSVRQQLPPPASRLARHLVRTFARGRCFRNRMAYIRMCDSIIRESPLHVFMDFLLRPLIRLSKDRVKNVRLCWATTMLAHVRKAGRLGHSPVLVGAAARMAAEDTDPEVRRVLSVVQLPELTESGDASIFGPESDLDESDKGENWLASSEGGTGNSSECGEVAVGVEEERWSEITPAKLLDGDQATASSSYIGASGGSGECDGGSGSPNTATSPTSSSPMGFHPPSRPVTSPAAVSQEVEMTEAAKSPTSSASAGSSPKAVSQVPQHPFHDAVEDGLVEQREVEKEIDAMFPSHRLFAAEAGALVKESSGGSLELVEKAATAPRAAPPVTPPAEPPAAPQAAAVRVASSATPAAPPVAPPVTPPVAAPSAASLAPQASSGAPASSAAGTGLGSPATATTVAAPSTSEAPTAPPLAATSGSVEQRVTSGSVEQPVTTVAEDLPKAVNADATPAVKSRQPSATLN